MNGLTLVGADVAPQATAQALHQAHRMKQASTICTVKCVLTIENKRGEHSFMHVIANQIGIRGSEEVRRNPSSVVLRASPLLDDIEIDGIIATLGGSVALVPASSILNLISVVVSNATLRDNTEIIKMRRNKVKISLE